MHNPPHFCLCLYLASGFWRFLWLDLGNINEYTRFYQIIPYCWRPAVISLFWHQPRSVKIGIWQVHWLDFVRISLCAKNYQIIPKVSRATCMGIFAYCHILALALPPSRNSGIWQFLCVDHVNINVYTKFYQHILPTASSIFSHLFPSALPWSKKSGIWQVYWLDLVGIYMYPYAMIKEKWHLASVLARSSRYLHVSVCQKLSNYSQRFVRKYIDTSYQPIKHIYMYSAINIVSVVIYLNFACLIRWFWRHVPTNNGGFHGNIHRSAKPNNFLISEPIYMIVSSNCSV